MEQLRPVSKREKILFPVITMIVIGLLVPPSAAPLIGMLMIGNLFRESGVVERLSKAAQEELMNIVTIFLGLGVGSTMRAESFLTAQTLMILGLGVVAFASATAGGVLFGKLMMKLSGGRINPMIGAAGFQRSRCRPGSSRGLRGKRIRATSSSCTPWGQTLLEL